MARKLFAGVRDLFTACMIVALAGCASSAAEPRQFGLDDLMQVEGFGSAVFDPTGRYLVYEQIRPYGSYGDYSFRTYAYEKSGHQLWRVDLATGIKPELLPGLDPAPHAYQQGFSPTGRYLMVMQYTFGELSLGAYDMLTDTYKGFGPVPAFSRAGEHNPVWISDEEIAYAALPDGAQPEATSVRAHTGKVLSRDWEAAWHGDRVTANEVRNTSEDRSGRQAPGRLIRANARTGDIQVLAEGLYADLRVASDGRHLAALAVSEPRPAAADTLVEADLRRYRLTLFDLASGSVRPLAPDLEFFPYTLAWAPDGTRLAAFGWRRDETPRDGRFHVVDTSTGAVTRYEHRGLDLVSERERGWRQRPERTVFLGEDLAMFARRVPTGEDESARFSYRDLRGAGLTRADWYAVSPAGTSRNLTAGLAGVSPIPLHASAGHLTVLAEDGVYQVGMAAGLRRLTPQLAGTFRVHQAGTFATRSSVIRPDYSNEALVTVEGDGPPIILMVDLTGTSRPVVIAAPSPGAVPLAGSHAAGTVLFRAEAGPVSRLLLAEADRHAAPRELSRINAHLEGIALGTWKRVAYSVTDPEGKVADGRLESCVLLPPDFDPAAPPPLVVEVYPDVGPFCPSDGAAMAYPDPDSAYLWVGKGFAYTRLATPKELIRTEDGPIAGLDEVVDAGVSALVAEGFADPDRLTLYGFSQGGISALYVAAKSPRFRAVIAKNSWADMFSHYFSGSGIYAYLYDSFGAFLSYDSVDGSDFGFGRTPFEDPDAYIRNSPVFLAPDFAMPVLLIHTDMDGFPMSQFDEMYGALQRAGKEVRYVRYWGEGHGPSSPANIRDMWQRQMDFLEAAGAAP
tara:strand:- start:9477 stop:12023 length:2547 start_codon:yes stop_codon:yes gene_type:complete